MKYIKFSIAVIVISFVVLGMLNGVIMTFSKGSGIVIEVVLYLLPLIVTILLIQYSWKKIVKEAEPSETDEKAKNMLKGVNQTINAVLKREDSVTVSDQEESIYEQVADELANNIKKEGLWLKAVEQAEGDEKKIQSLYIKYRAQAIRKSKLQEERILNRLENEDLQNNKEEDKPESYFKQLSQAEIDFINRRESSVKKQKGSNEVYETADNSLKATVAFIIFGVVFIMFYKFILVGEVYPTTTEEESETTVNRSKKVLEIDSLKWMDVSDLNYSLFSLDEAKRSCADIGMRLPTTQELQYIVRDKDKNHGMTTAGYISSDGFVVNFKDQSVYASGGYKYHVRCVADDN